MNIRFILSFPLFVFTTLGAQEPDPWEAIPLDSKPSLKIESKKKNSTWKTGSIAMNQGDTLSLRVANPGDQSSEIRWFQIVPDISRTYKNANHPWEENPYKWVGFGKITYQRREIVTWRTRWEIDEVDTAVFKIPGSARYYQNNLGSFWIDAEVKMGERRKRTVGLQENNERNLSPKVFRLTIRKNDGYIGHLTGFFNVPGLFGSNPYQSNNYIGVDCADVLVAARRQWINRVDAKDYNVAMLVSAWPRVAKFQLNRGAPSDGKTVTWGKSIKPGDIIAVKYEGRSRYQHIGALYEDSNENGILDGADTVIHAGPEALHTTRLRRGSFDGEVVILRPTK